MLVDCQLQFNYIVALKLKERSLQLHPQARGMLGGLHSSIGDPKGNPKAPLTKGTAKYPL